MAVVVSAKMNKLHFLFLVALPLGNTACSSTAQLTNVDRYVIEACGITKSESGDSKGQWVAPPMESAVETWSVYGEVSNIEKQRDIWKSKIVPATAAAQLNEVFRPLADAIKSMLDTTTLVIQFRTSQGSLVPAYEGLNQYNSHLDTWRTECNATSARLPS